ncbi:glutamate-5-semialdehyde dehydrogenase [Brevibacillus aydinogluensis]|uniref:Gamma-glutamyl phosphate reductase n=1 Tax=Brevibacillus aydinogluensis TaxID=927786 RepID=A0AA48M640_9BACL|nr:glutamate-5-semialdehyde dehydrogenase [Brevibacillus aydinogluensis]
MKQAGDSLALKEMRNVEKSQTEKKPHMEQNLKERVYEQIRLAKQASRHLALLSRPEKDRALKAIGERLLADKAAILAANERDMARAEADGQPAAYLDRLRLTPDRLRDLVEGLGQLVALNDPVGEVTAQWTRPNGLVIQQVRVPLGVIGMVYEARPNVTVDAAAIALKTGNAIVLRGSRSARESNLALTHSIRAALADSGLPAEAVQYLPYDAHESVDLLCTANGLIDVVIPRGGASLISRVLRTSTVPVLETGVGNCHIYIDRTAEYAMAETITLNAKTSRPAVCNAAETLLLHRAWPEAHRRDLLARLMEAGIELRACEETRRLHPELADRLVPATPADWDAEYLGLILAVRTVDSMDDALDHISRHGTGHSEAIVAQDAARAERFLAAVDAAAVYHNASTRFTDGGEFGFGAEIGISTQKLHARGPMGLPALTSSKYVVRGSGQIR